MNKFKVFGAALLAVFVIAGMANAQLCLIPNGDFEVAGGDSWTFANSADSNVSFETTGGNTGGFGRIDATGGNWGGVLVAEGGTGPAPALSDGIDLSTLGLMAGDTITFQWDQIDLLGNGAIAGIKLESWADTDGDGTNDFLNDSMDQLVATNGTWTTESYSYTIDPTATAIKVVLVQNQGFNGNGGAITGFDNVAFIKPDAVPEPGTAGLIGLGVMGLLLKRRRKA